MGKILIASEHKWLTSLAAKHGGDTCVYVGSTPTFKSARQEDGSMLIPGMASTNDIDRESDIIVPEAFIGGMDEFAVNPILLSMHQWTELPLGKVLNWEITENGLFVNPRISPTSFGKDAMILIEDGVLKTFSIGFRIIEDKYDRETDVRTILKLNLYEVSVVNIPANPYALMEAAEGKSLAIKSLLKSFPGWGDGRNGKDTPMPQPNAQDFEQSALFKRLERIVGNFNDADDSIAVQLAMTKQNIDELNGIIKTYGEKLGNVQGNLLGQSEFMNFTERITGDIKGLQDSLHAVKAFENIRKTRYLASDWKELADGTIYLTDDNEKPLPEIDQKCWKMFSVPVEKDSPDGRLLKMTRDIHDVVLFRHAYQKYAYGVDGARSMTIQSTEYRTLQQMVKYFDEDLFKAMWSEGTATGAEWIPTYYSAEMEELYRLELKLASYISEWNMPAGTCTYPLKAGSATCYKGNEAASNNPPIAKRSEFATGNVQFSAEELIAVIPVSVKHIEDSIVDMVTEIRKELVVALAEGEESCDINGDNSTTHMDNATTELYDPNFAVETCWKGLRKLSIDQSTNWNTQSTTAGVGDATTAFAALDMRYGREIMGDTATKPNEGLFVLGVGAFFSALSFSQVTKANEFGSQSTWLTGTLPSLDGTEIYISSKMPSNLNASGIYDGTTTDNTGFIHFNKRGVKRGVRRGVSIEFKKDILTQQLSFVATKRADLQKMWPTTKKVSSYGYNIDN